MSEMKSDNFNFKVWKNYLKNGLQIIIGRSSLITILMNMELKEEISYMNSDQKTQNYMQDMTGLYM